MAKDVLLNIIKEMKADVFVNKILENVVEYIYVDLTEKSLSYMLVVFCF